jgi:hypothetical protein
MVYRDAEEALRQRRGELLALRRREALALPASLVAVYARRQARRHAGSAAIALAGLLAFDALRGADGLTAMLEVSWPLVALVYLFTRVAAGQNLRARLYRAAHPTGDVLGDVDRLEGWSPVAQAIAETRALEARSVAPALTGLALIVPLSLQLLLLMMLDGDRIDGRESDTWIRTALVYEGHCHLVLAALAWRFGQRVPSLAGVREAASVAGWQAWAVMILTSMGAAVLFALLGPLIGFGLAIVGPAVVAATGLMFVPAMFAAIGRTVARERRLLVMMQFSQPIVRMEGRA